MQHYQSDFLTLHRLGREDEREPTNKRTLRAPPMQEVRQWVTILLSLSLPPVNACLPPVRRQQQCWWCTGRCQTDNTKRRGISESHECKNYRYRHRHRHRRRRRQLIVLNKKPRWHDMVCNEIPISISSAVFGRFFLLLRIYSLRRRSSALLAAVFGRRSPLVCVQWFPKNFDFVDAWLAISHAGARPRRNAFCLSLARFLVSLAKLLCTMTLLHGGAALVIYALFILALVRLAVRLSPLWPLFCSKAFAIYATNSCHMAHYLNRCCLPRRVAYVSTNSLHRANAIIVSRCCEYLPQTPEYLDRWSDVDLV